jgi:hypothetical protein
MAETLDIYTSIEKAQHRDGSERLGQVFGIGKSELLQRSLSKLSLAPFYTLSLSGRI